MNRKWIKLILDIVMAAAFVLLMNLSFTGLMIHEGLGLGVLAFFTLHLWLNENWIKGVIGGLGRGRIANPAKFRFALDLALLILMALIIISGIQMSQVLFPFLASGNHSFWYTLHVGASVSCSALLALHAVLHWRFIWNGARGMVGNRSIRRWSAGVLAAFLLFFLIKSVFFGSDDTDSASLAALSSGNSVTGDSGSSGGQQNETITSSGKSDEEDEDSQTITTPSVTQTVSLEDYLSKLVCTGCGRHCSLLSPRCAKGELQAAQAEQAYYEEYGTE